VITLFEALLLVIIVVFFFLRVGGQTFDSGSVPYRLRSWARSSSFRCSVSQSTHCRSSGWCWPIGLVVDDAIVVVEAVEHHMSRACRRRRRRSRQWKRFQPCCRYSA